MWSGLKNRGQGLQGASRISDTVVENDDGSGNEILLDQPADVPDRGMDGVVGISAAEDAGVAALAG